MSEQEKDDAGHTAIEEIRTKPKRLARVIIPASFDTEQRSNFVWGLADAKMRHGELKPKEALIWAIRNGADVPADLEFRKWLADGLEGKHDSERGRGRPRKKQRWDPWASSVENHVLENYRKWLVAFQLHIVDQ